MSEVKPASYYDGVYSDPADSALLPLELSPWLPVYEAAAAWIGPGEPVMDLGCGTGRFAAQLYLGSRYGFYWGWDFSKVAIDEATSYSKERGFQKHAAYMVCDLDEVERGPFGEALPGNAIFTCLEVLEHLEDDLALVKRIPPGFLFIASVPNSPSVAHVRTFPTVGSVFERYGRELILERWQRIELDERHGIHLFQGRRRSDSW